MTQWAFSTINEAKANFDQVYVEKDPRQYFNYLGSLDYIIPHLAQPIFEQLIRARAQVQREPVTVLDLGSSYGVNGALMKYALSYDALRDRYTAPSCRACRARRCSSSIALSTCHGRATRMCGSSAWMSRKMPSGTRRSGTMDVGLCADLEDGDPTSDIASAIAEADIIVSTGCVGYVTSKTFDRVMALASKGRRPGWRRSCYVCSHTTRSPRRLAVTGWIQKKSKAPHSSSGALPDATKWKPPSKPLRSMESTRMGTKRKACITPTCLLASSLRDRAASASGN